MTVYHWLMLVVAAALGLGGGWFVQQQLAEEPAPAAEEQPPADMPSIVGEQRPDFTLPDLDGDPVPVSRFDGDLLVINFWATWCPPCVEEVPMLIELQADMAEEGLTVLGVAVEEVEPVREFAEDFGINYPLVVGVRSGFAVVEDYGNPRGTLPYTVFVDRDGVVRGVHNGLLTRSQAEQHLEAMQGN